MKIIFKCHWCDWEGEEAQMLSMTVRLKDGTTINKTAVCPLCHKLHNLEEYDQINVPDNWKPK